MMKKLSILFGCILASCGGGGSGSDSAEPEVQGSVETTPPPAPEPKLVKALDISIWSGEISDAHVQQWKDAGFTHVIVGCQNLTVAKQQLTKLVAGGMTVDVYKYLYFSTNWTTVIQAALAMAEPFPIGKMWLDLEDAPDGYDVYAIIAKIQEAIDACGSTPVGFYTGWFWRNNMQGCAKFAEYPLWTARYDGIQNFNFWKDWSFGGWVMPTGKQYMGDTTVGGNGVDVDTNILWIGLTGDPEPPEGVPAIPTDLSPNGTDVTTSSTTITWSNTGASKYQIILEKGQPGSWAYSWTWTTTTPNKTVYPQSHGKYYRYRVRGQNSIGWGKWSEWVQFYFP